MCAVEIYRCQPRRCLAAAATAQKSLPDADNCTARYVTLHMTGARPLIGLFKHIQMHVLNSHSSLCFTDQNSISERPGINASSANVRIESLSLTVRTSSRVQNYTLIRLFGGGTGQRGLDGGDLRGAAATVEKYQVRRWEGVPNKADYIAS